MLNDPGMTVADRIAEELAHRILTGALGPGTRLRQEVFALEFGASHVPVREAFRRLETQRLVESVPRRGVRVAPLDSRGEREIASMRSALEVLALRSIVGRVSPRQLEVIKAAVEAGDNAADIYAWEAANRAFHVALAAPCNMPRLIAAIADLNLAYSRHVFAADRPAEWRPRSNHGHRQIYEAFAAANYNLAANLLAAHIKTVDRVAPRPPAEQAVIKARGVFP
jgi:DNA-binding GntR family transcriptional regulator